MKAAAAHPSPSMIHPTYFKSLDTLRLSTILTAPYAPVRVALYSSEEIRETPPAMVEDKEQRSRQGHPLLRARGVRKEPYTHGFSATQMLALTAACGALVPSLPPDNHPAADSKAVRDFFLASAADPPVPDEVSTSHLTLC